MTDRAFNAPRGTALLQSDRETLHFPTGGVFGIKPTTTPRDHHFRQAQEARAEIDAEHMLKIADLQIRELTQDVQRALGRPAGDDPFWPSAA